MIKQKVC